MRIDFHIQRLLYLYGRSMLPKRVMLEDFGECSNDYSIVYITRLTVVPAGMCRVMVVVLSASPS